MLWPKVHVPIDPVGLNRHVLNKSCSSRNGAETSAPPSLQAGVDPKALLGDGRFEQQTVARLKQLCRDHRITGFSKLKKAELAAANSITPPPRPLESFIRHLKCGEGGNE